MRPDCGTVRRPPSFTRSAAGLAVLALPATASEQDLTEDEARRFLDGLGSRAAQAVSEFNWQGIRDWMQTHVSDCNLRLARREGEIVVTLAACRTANTM